MTQPDRQWTARGGDRQRVDPGMLVNRLPDYDPRSGAHLWVVANCYRVTPERWEDRTHEPTLDAENLLSITVPFCYYCEQPWTSRLTHRRCPGEPA